MSWNTRRAFAAAVLAALAMCGLAPAQSDTASAVAATDSVTPQAHSTATDPTYVIGADDLLAVNVWKEPDLSRALPVRPDGKITLPLVGDMQASGLTPKQLQAALEKGFDKYVSNPTVTVIVQEVRSQKFNILGEVQRPGSYALTNATTVLDAIALAGGFRDWAKVKSIYVLRPRPDGGSDRLPFNYKRVIKGHGAQNVQLVARDTIVVP